MTDERTMNRMQGPGLKPYPLMAHLVAGFPDTGRSLAVAEALVDGGAKYLEVQFPFSDPSADGPVIEAACQHSLRNGFRTSGGFELVRRILSRRSTEIFIMSYAGLVFARGVERFVSDAAAAGAKGLIIPDLPPDYDEGLFDAGRRAGIHIVPVIAPSITAERLSLVASVNPQYLYTAIRTGITGSYTAVDAELSSFLSSLRRTTAHIFAGFGIQERPQVEALLPYIDIVVAGSVFVKIIDEYRGETEEKLAAAVRTKAAELCGL